MITLLVVILMPIFVLGTISPLLIAEDMQDIVSVGQSLEPDGQRK
jgi:hypothetical protein